MPLPMYVQVCVGRGVCSVLARAHRDFRLMEALALSTFLPFFLFVYEHMLVEIELESRYSNTLDEQSATERT